MHVYIWPCNAWVGQPKPRLYNHQGQRGAVSFVSRKKTRQMTKIRVRRILRAVRLSDSTNERQEIISLIG